jgi:hypothetical protein
MKPSVRTAIRTSTPRLFLALGLLCPLANPADAQEIVRDCTLGANGDACVFDVTAQGTGTLLVDTKAARFGARWRVTVAGWKVGSQATPIASSVGNGAVSVFGGRASTAIDLGRKYVVIVSYESPLGAAAVFPTGASVRLIGPVRVSQQRKRSAGSTLPGLPPLPGRYAGTYIPGFVRPSFAMEVSADRKRIVWIAATDVGCGFARRCDFEVALSPGIAITAGADGLMRFVQQDIPVAMGEETHSLDIDGVLFDADGFGNTAEQALGALSYSVGGADLDHYSWSAATLDDEEGDGWGRAGEIRLGSDPAWWDNTPEDKRVPTTSGLGPDPCHDFDDNDRDGQVDAQDPGCR